MYLITSSFILWVPKIPQNTETLCQFLSPQTNKMKRGIISSILTGSCIHATVTFGVGIGSFYDERVIHFGVACATSHCGPVSSKKVEEQAEVEGQLNLLCASTMT